MDAFSRISVIGLLVLLMCLLLAYGVGRAGVDTNAYPLKADFNDELNDGLSGAKRQAVCTARRFIF